MNNIIDAPSLSSPNIVLAISNPLATLVPEPSSEFSIFFTAVTPLLWLVLNISSLNIPSSASVIVLASVAALPIVVSPVPLKTAFPSSSNPVNICALLLYFTSSTELVVLPSGRNALRNALTESYMAFHLVSA